MELNSGFDMVPSLSRGIVDTQNWNRFIDLIKERYKDDTQVEIYPNYISFNAGDQPKLPFEGHKFLRFSSEVSQTAGNATGVEYYIEAITIMAQASFGSRVQTWRRIAHGYGVYGWKEVQESIKAYEQNTQLDDLEVLTSVAHPDGTDRLREPELPLYEIKDIPSKGKGLIARFNISSGTRILCEKPLLTAQPLPRELLEPVLAAKLKALSKDSQRQFFSLHNNFPSKYPFSGIVKTNALPCGSSSQVGGVYPTACLINHSCIPNAYNN